MELSHGLAWEAAAYFVSRPPFQQVASYTRVDTQLTWRVAERVELNLVGQNLLHDHHVESLDALTLVNSSLVKRSAYAKMSWTF
jgi:iron complex outermembrane recepter protein